MPGRIALTLVLMALIPSMARAQRKEALIILKDGFTIRGKVIEQRDFFIDPESKQSFTIPKAGSLINLDDFVRRIFFIPGQLQEVIEKKDFDRDLIELKRYGVRTAGDSILP